MLGALDNLHQPREHIAFHDAELAVAALQESNNQSQYQETALILLTRWASQEAAVEGGFTGPGRETYRQLCQQAVYLSLSLINGPDLLTSSPSIFGRATLFLGMTYIYSGYANMNTAICVSVCEAMRRQGSTFCSLSPHYKACDLSKDFDRIFSVLSSVQDVTLGVAFFLKACFSDDSLCCNLLSSWFFMIDSIAIRLYEVPKSAPASALIEYELTSCTSTWSRTIGQAILDMMARVKCSESQIKRANSQSSPPASMLVFDLLCTATAATLANNECVPVVALRPQGCLAGEISCHILECPTIQSLDPTHITTLISAVEHIFKAAKQSEHKTGLEYVHMRHTAAQCYSMMHNNEIWPLIYKSLPPLFVPTLAVGLLFGPYVPLRQLNSFSSLNYNREMCKDWLKRHMVGMFKNFECLARCIMSSFRFAQTSLSAPHGFHHPVLVSSSLECFISAFKTITLDLHLCFSDLSFFGQEYMNDVLGGDVMIKDLLEMAYVSSLAICFAASDLLLDTRVQACMLQSSFIHATMSLLCVSADVSFCRPSGLTLAKDLATKLFPLQGSGTDGALMLIDQLPCYSNLVQHAPNIRGPRWLVDSVLVSKILTLTPLICASLTLFNGDELPSVTEKMLPYAYLLLRHSQDATCLSAHAIISAVVSALCACNHHNLAGHVLPFYIHQSVQPPWLCPGQISGLLLNFPSAIRAVLSGRHESGCVYWSLSRLAASAAEWIASQTPALVPDFENILREPPGNISGSQIVSLACSIPLLSEWSSLSDSVLMAERVVSAATSGPIRDAVLQHIHDILSLSDDYTRKGLLAEWFLKLKSKYHN